MKDKILKNKKYLLIIIVFILILVIGLLGNLKHSTSDKVINGFMKELSNGNVQKVYKYLNVEESDFVNEKAFVSIFKENDCFHSNLKDYKIVPQNTSNDDKKYYDIYINDDIVEIEVIKVNSKWKINLNNMYRENIKLDTDKTISKIDNNMVDNKYLKNSKYTIPKLFDEYAFCEFNKKEFDFEKEDDMYYTTTCMNCNHNIIVDNEEQEIQLFGDLKFIK